jgi:hypothetical protein
VFSDLVESSNSRKSNHYRFSVVRRRLDMLCKVSRPPMTCKMVEGCVYVRQALGAHGQEEVLHVNT